MKFPAHRGGRPSETFTHLVLARGGRLANGTVKLLKHALVPLMTTGDVTVRPSLPHLEMLYNLPGLTQSTAKHLDRLAPSLAGFLNDGESPFPATDLHIHLIQSVCSLRRKVV